MELLVDLHVHSHYSRATSKDCTFAGLYKWGKLKGINIIGTGDFTHPEWFKEMQDSLEPAEGGLYKLKDKLAAPIDKLLPASIKNNIIRFIPTVEIATIYSKGGKVRKLHQLIVMPNFKSVDKLNARLERIGNLRSDGRPILGLDSKDLLKHAIQSSPDALYIPAHIWTPWFGMFGSKSGFDSIAETFEELAPEIRVIETGLSSDPGMNWRVPHLDGLSITSNSDAHSPGKLGREATVLNTELSYDNLMGAYKSNDSRLAGTIEFFPEEGKYHHDGHRACGVRFTPEETKRAKGICPVCSKPVVVGVDYRVTELAERPPGHQPEQPKQVEYIIPLVEIIAELKGTKSITVQSVIKSYHHALEKLGSEFSILRQIPIAAIEAASMPNLALAIKHLRAGDVVCEPGFDGVYGSVRVFKNPIDRQLTTNQASLL